MLNLLLLAVLSQSPDFMLLGFDAPLPPTTAPISSFVSIDVDPIILTPARLPMVGDVEWNLADDTTPVMLSSHTGPARAVVGAVGRAAGRVRTILRWRPFRNWRPFGGRFRGGC